MTTTRQYGTDSDVDTVDLSVVVVSYRCRNSLLECLRSLEAGIGVLKTEVIVVDNGSKDGTLESLRALYPDVLVKPMGMNAGFSRAANVGFSLARGRHVLALNPDTLVMDSALETLVMWLDEHPSAGVAAPRLLNPDGTDQRTARALPTPSAGLFGRRSPLTRVFPNNRWSRGYLSGSERTGPDPFTTGWVSGAAMMVPASVIACVGVFDEAFFLFWEDADWCKRIKDAGFDTWCVPTAIVVHDEGTTRGHRWAPRIVVWFHRGSYLYWRKHHAPQPWNPLRWLAAGALAARAAIVMVNEVLRAARASEGINSPKPIRLPQPSR